MAGGGFTAQFKIMVAQAPRLHRQRLQARRLRYAPKEVPLGDKDAIINTRTILFWNAL
jgi:allophanate hydrolase subunit 1